MVFIGCSTTSYSYKNSFKALNQADRQTLVRHAQHALGKNHIKMGKKSFRADCSGTIRGLFAQSGLSLGGVLKTKDDNDVKSIYRFVSKYGRILKSSPAPGDLIFFHNTYDRNRSGLLDNALTHIGIVEKIDKDTVYFIHHLDKSIIRSRMNLRCEKDAIDSSSGGRLNHVLRKASGIYPAFTAKELFAGFGRL